MHCLNAATKQRAARRVKAFENRAHGSFNSKDYDRAIADYGEAVKLSPKDAILLCHKFCRCLRDDRRMQHWHRCRVIAIATANKRWMVAIELGTWRCGRIGGAAGSVTAGKGRFFDRSGAMRC